MIALISDIHGNFEALKEVFRDIDAHRAEPVIFLGDVVGYGPEPEACIDLLEKRGSVFLMGNHDHAMLHEPVNFNPIAAEAIHVLKHRMQPEAGKTPLQQRRWQFLTNLRNTYREKDLLFVHGSPRDPFSEYITPTDAAHDPEKIQDILSIVDRLVFCGHTHYPGVIEEGELFYTPGELEQTYKFTDKKAILNVGSVGQPRDGNPEACYLLLHEDRVEWRRIPYDVEATIKSIEQIEGLHPRNGERLRLGR